MTLKEELKDVCEVDRLHRCYELTFDDGSTARVSSAKEARELADQVRQGRVTPHRTAS